MSRNHERLKKLFQKVEQEKIRVEFLSGNLSRDWYGLYIKTRAMGTMIGLREGLTNSMVAWVLSHELGHHFNQSEQFLFSPFIYPFISSKKTTAGIESRADEFALALLTTPAEWKKAEKLYPVDLKRIVSKLELPIEAGVSWERMMRKQYSRNAKTSIRFSPHLWQEIQRRVKGKGGAQDTFRRILRPRKGNESSLSRYDFSLVRERAATMEGGFADTFKKIVAEIEAPIKAKGGVDFFFKF